jgi:hypothetical protein
MCVILLDNRYRYFIIKYWLIRRSLVKAYISIGQGIDRIFSSLALLPIYEDIHFTENLVALQFQGQINQKHMLWKQSLYSSRLSSGGN